MIYYPTFIPILIYSVQDLMIYFKFDWTLTLHDWPLLLNISVDNETFSSADISWWCLELPAHWPLTEEKRKEKNRSQYNMW